MMQCRIKARVLRAAGPLMEKGPQSGAFLNILVIKHKFWNLFTKTTDRKMPKALFKILILVKILMKFMMDPFNKLA